MQSACLAVSLLCLVSFSRACYFNNCPIGGKRSIMNLEIRQCMQCGPENKGHCFGSRICCGERFGCYIGTSETVKCEKENYIFSPCEPIGRSCGKEGGKCASSGICCTEQSCVMDTTCETSNVYSSN
ncbi:hypothetical protein scyTo_2000032 [Scyliorhinus torazame]|uniref:Uncharacterized protein n=1 Tax=Scyliorhinus torazame TaxID=75743 RepID=A0A401PQR5_SCYTO|nr:hypothetical protein [Scyliorhinus torazame]